MKCVLDNCQFEGVWHFRHEGQPAMLCDAHYRNLAVTVLLQSFDFEAKTVFGRAMTNAKEDADKVLCAQPNPKEVSPNVSITVGQASLAIANLSRQNHLTKVQTAIAASMIARYLLRVAQEAHAESVVQN